KRASPPSARGLLHLVLFFFARLGARAAHRLDAVRRQPRLLGDFTVLLLDDRLGWLVAVETLERLGRYPAVRTLGSILLQSVGQDEFAAGAGSRFAGHAVGPSFFSFVARTLRT